MSRPRKPAPAPVSAYCLEAQAKVDRALEHVEAAQRLLGRACEELCPIVGVIDRWEAIGKLYDDVHAEWHRLNLRRSASNLTLDSDAKRRFDARNAAHVDSIAKALVAASTPTEGDPQ